MKLFEVLIVPYFPLEDRPHSKVFLKNQHTIFKQGVADNDGFTVADPHPHPHPHQGVKSDPDPHQGKKPDGALEAHPGALESHSGVLDGPNLFKNLKKDPDPHQSEQPEPDPDPHHSEKPDQDPHQSKRSDPDPYEGDADPQHRFNVLLFFLKVHCLSAHQ